MAGPFDDGIVNGDGGAAEAPRMGTSEDPDGSQTENAILESEVAAMCAALEKAVTSTLAQMPATQDRRDTELQKSPALLTATLAEQTIHIFPPTDRFAYGNSISHVA